MSRSSLVREYQNRSENYVIPRLRSEKLKIQLKTYDMDLENYS